MYCTQSQVRLGNLSPSWPLCPPRSSGLTSTGSRSRSPRMTCRGSLAPAVHSYYKQSGSLVSSSACNLQINSLLDPHVQLDTYDMYSMVYHVQHWHSRLRICPTVLHVLHVRHWTCPTIRTLTSPVHPPLTVLRVPQETVHQMEEIVVVLLQDEGLLLLSSLPPGGGDMNYSQEGGEEQHGAALK